MAKGAEMIDVLILYDVDGWAYHFRALALQRYCPEGFRVRIAAMDAGSSPQAPVSTESLSPELKEENSPRKRLEEIFGTDAPPDVVLTLCSFLAKPVRRFLDEMGWATKVIVSSNNGWPRRFEQFQNLFKHADWVVLNNREYWERAEHPERCSAISNGVDLTKFYLEKPISSRAPKVIWCGSQLHRDIKGYDEFIVPIFEQLRREGVECEALLVDSRGSDRLNRDQMRSWYNSATVFVCTSDTEGTPNPALEAAACGCTVVTTRVGNMPELIKHGVNGIFVDRNIDSILDGIRSAVANSAPLATELFRDIQSWCWSTRSKEYFRLFAEVAGKLRSSSQHTQIETRNNIDSPTSCNSLRDEVTVFVSTVNNDSFQECMKHLSMQDTRFHLEVIENVAPMSAAFQRMLDRCKTPFYVQVDEDMLLRPWAIRKLHERIVHSPSDHAFAVEWLWDSHLNRPIQGVKIYRHATVKQFPYRDVQSCEKDQIARLQEAGYSFGRPVEAELDEQSPEIFGNHGVYFHPESVYERYFTLMQKKLKDPKKFRWLDRHLDEFFQRFRTEPTEFNLMAIMGILAGHLQDSQTPGEKDFREYSSLPGLQPAKEFFAQCRSSQHTSGNDQPET